MKILFIPFSVVGGLVAGLISKSIFDFIWARISEQEAPEPEHREISWPELAAALAIEGAVFRVSRGLVDHGSRIGFYRLTGSWPGEEEPEST
ncbi:MAG TPA: DUF4235 domain-containing protein [Solirubrobacterales bacterium]|nr:DUF4235 domain-containing protein [Solirubrobacterales bacterium]